VLPADGLKVFQPEFRWLGSLTNPCRDLDVYLLEMDGFRALVGDSAAALAPLQEVIETERQLALGEVRAGLRTRRFQSLLDGWQAFLDDRAADHEPPPTPPARCASWRRRRSGRRIGGCVAVA